VVAGAVIAGVAFIAVVALRRKRSAEMRATAPAESAKGRTPWTRGDLISIAGIVVGAAVGVAGLALSGGSSESSTAKELNPTSYAALLRAGPFSGQLPEGLEPRGLAEVQVGDSSAAGRIDAMQLKVRPTTAAAPYVFAHYEVYPSPKAAQERAKARIGLLKRIIGSEAVQGSPSSYCSTGTIGGPDSWECGGTNGLVYAEATVSPSSNALQPVATSTASALLDYAEERALVARG
jgi:hypothetical protein